MAKQQQRTRRRRIVSNSHNPAAVWGDRVVLALIVLIVLVSVLSMLLLASGFAAFQRDGSGSRAARVSFATVARVFSSHPSTVPAQGQARMPPESGPGSAPWDSLSWEAVEAAALRHPRAEVLSPRSPRLVLVRGFLSPRECDHLVALADDILQQSEVVATDTLSTARTSRGAFLNRRSGRKDEVVDAIDARVHELIGLPRDHGESLHVLRYGPGEQYAMHMDSCRPLDPGDEVSGACVEFLKRAGGPECGPGAGGPACGDRVATVIVYLQAATEGGGTSFPFAVLGRGNAASPRPVPPPPARPRAVSTSQQEDAPRDGPPFPLPTLPTRAVARTAPSYCEPGSGALIVQPEAGDALVFWSYVPGGEGPAVPDPGARHAGCPPMAGDKVVATKWVRSAPFLRA